MNRYFIPKEEANEQSHDEHKPSNSSLAETGVAISRVKKKSHGKTEEELMEDSELVKLRPKKAVTEVAGEQKLDKELEIKRMKGVKSSFQANKIRSRREREQAGVAFSERIKDLTKRETPGYVECDADERITEVRQSDIVDSVDITSAEKHFELQLNDYGPYRIDYSRSGQHLLIGGRRGHIASFDWLTKSLQCEFSPHERVTDVHWLHNDDLFAAAQRKWLRIYDCQGVELHCIAQMHEPLRLAFLPFHLLLTCSTAHAWLHWLDVSIGRIVRSTPTHTPRPLNVLASNPCNALLACGHPNGRVTMWSPNEKEAVVKTMCHVSPLTSLVFDRSGKFMVTAATDSRVRVWDLRAMKLMSDFAVGSPVRSLALSDTGILAMGTRNTVQTMRDALATFTDPAEATSRLYLRHSVHGQVADIAYCPFEDVLGVGHATGFDSMLVPGAGEPNFDALGANPTTTKRQKREQEVRNLLDKLPAEMITLNEGAIGEVDEEGLQERLEELRTVRYQKPDKVQLRKKAKGKTKASKLEGRTRALRHEQTKAFMKRKRTMELLEAQKKKMADDDEEVDNEQDQQRDVLDRFSSKETLRRRRKSKQRVIPEIENSD